MIGWLVGAAWAGLAWSWPEGTRHRYVIHNEVDLSEVFWLRAELNKERRVIGWRTSWNLLCEGRGPAGRRAFVVRCRIEDLRVSARPNGPSDREGLREILDEWDRRLVGASLELEFHRDGRLRAFDLVDVRRDKRNQRSREMELAMRLVAERAVVGLELSLPERDPPPAEGWPGKPLRLLAVPSNHGTLGGAEVVSRVKEQRGDEVVVEMSASGIRGPAIDAPDKQQVNQWAFRCASTYRFNTRVGVLTYREALCEAMPTPSSPIAMSSVALPYVQAIRVERKSPSRELEPFGPNEVIDD